MVGKVIRDYMEGGAKKLTVPGFGTFMRRGGDAHGDGNAHSGGNAHGDIIFVDLLRTDDNNTLSEMVEDRGGLSELEAMARIDRWIFETRNAVERRGSATIEGFGTLTIDHKGVYKFNHSPVARLVKETAVQERLFEAGGTTPSVGRPTATPPQEGNRLRGTTATPAPKKRVQPKKSSPADTILIVAIIAAAIALVALVFGMSSAGMPFLSN